MIYKIINLRAYADAKEIYDSTPMDKRPKTPMVELVGEIKVGMKKKEIAEYLAAQTS